MLFASQLGNDWSDVRSISGGGISPACKMQGWVTGLWKLVSTKLEIYSWMQMLNTARINRHAFYLGRVIFPGKWSWTNGTELVWESKGKLNTSGLFGLKAGDRIPSGICETENIIIPVPQKLNIRIGLENVNTYIITA